MPRNLTAILLALAGSVSLWAQVREPVLKQIDEPHSYYYREMYLPQLTTGPSAVAWMPDGHAVVYAMAGSLWRQKLNSTEAEQLTAGPGYDYQPDCSADGRWVVYASYYRDAVELWALELATGRTTQLTNNQAVNLEPRFSPDGSRIVFVSTSYHGRFHIFGGQFDNGQLREVERWTGESRSSLPRYYYSAFDLEISPAWMPDGKEIVFVSNRNHIYGTGGFWRMKAEPNAEAREIHYEETTWKARPDVSPDGTRLVYASYLGQQWHQLWLLPSGGGDGFPVSYGDFDNINPRFSPDGKRIAFISNRNGNTELWVQETLGGAQTRIEIRHRHTLHLTGTLQISVLDASGRATAARVSVTGADGKAYAPDDAWIRADDNFVRSERPFEAHYFHTAGRSEVRVPAGAVTVEAMKGFEYELESRSVRVAANQSVPLRITLKKFSIPGDPGARWASGDVHVHMNYAGHYRDTPARLVAQAQAENLSVVEDLIVNKEQRIPDIAYFSPQVDAASTADVLLVHGQEYHTSYWGHLGLLNLTRHFLLPGYAAYPGTAAASLFPANANVADMAHEQGALVGYVHPFDSAPDPAKDERLTDELPVDVALGKVDYIEVVGFSDHRSTAEVWYRLLNCGFRLPAAGGTDAMANYASMRGPVGLDRVYVRVPQGKLAMGPWLAGLKQGATFATNGPLLGFKLGNKAPGDTLGLAEPSKGVAFQGWVRSIVPVDHVQVVCNGEVVKEYKAPARKTGASLDISGTLPLEQSGWCLLRAWSEHAEHPVLDLYPYATTSPVYVQVAGSKVRSPKDAAFFVAWIDRLIEAAKAHTDWNNDGERTAVLSLLAYAQDLYRQMAK